MYMKGWSIPPRGVIVTKNSELERRIDVWSQTSSTPPVVKLSFKVDTMTFDKSGYIVSEEPPSRFMEDPSYKLADKTGMKDRFSKWMDSLSHQGERKVLYIGKYYIKASIGIDFTRITFSVRDGIEESSDTWYSLKDHIQDPRVLPIVSNMLLMADVLSGTTDFQNRRLCINNPIV